MTTHSCRAIDTHAHWYPAQWLRLFEKDGPAEGASLERNANRYIIRTSRVVNAFDEEFVDLDLRLAGMDRQRVDMHALSLTAPMVYWASPGLGLALSQAYNDAVSAAHLRHPARFVGLAMLPMQAPGLGHRKKLPSEYLRRFSYAVIGRNDEINYNLARMVGADRLVLGSDYCFDMGLSDPLGTVARLERLTQAERDLIIGHTPAKLLGL